MAATLPLFIMVPVLPPEFPFLNADGPSVIQYYMKYRHDFLIGNYLGAFAIVPSMIQLAYVCGVYRRIDRDRGWYWIVVLGSGLCLYGASLVMFSIYQVTALEATPGNDAVARALSNLANMCFFFTLLPQGLFLLANGLAVLTTKAFPLWLGWLALVSGLFNLVASGGAIVLSAVIAHYGWYSANIGTALLFLNVSLLSIHLLGPARESAV